MSASIDPQNNVTIDRGDGEPLNYDIFDADGAPLVVDTWSWAFTVKKYFDDVIGAAKFQKTGGGGGITVVAGKTQAGAPSGVNNRVRVQLAASDTEALSGDHVYDLQGHDGTHPHTPAKGRFRISKDVTTPGTAGQPSFGVIVFPGGTFAIGSDGTIYFKDTTTLLWSAFRVTGENWLQSTTQSSSIPFWN